MKGKHASDEGLDFDSIPWKNILLVIVVLAVIIGVLFGGKTVYSNFLANASFFNKEKPEETDETEIEIEEKMPTQLYGYKVLGELTFENKNFSKYILDATNDNAIYTDKSNNETENSDNEVLDQNNSLEISDALNKSIVKLYGDKLNQKGNFTIIGHNKDEYFSILNELNVGEEFLIKTSDTDEKKYIITEIYTIEPTDLKALMPNNDYTEVTLITCSTGSNQRLVVKALEETDYEIYKSANLTNINENSDNTLADNSTEEVVQNTITE